MIETGYTYWKLFTHTTHFLPNDFVIDVYEIFLN